jgi:glycosyltransferase involved in cell wall biosynthesis
MKKIAVLIPCYNEEMTVQKVASDFKKELRTCKIYVYDNNSTDNSAVLAKKAGAIVRPEPKLGKGNVVRSMFRDIDADCYLMVDADDTYSPKHAKKMIDLVLNGKCDMVVGDRLSGNYYKENNRKLHNFGNKLISNLVKRCFKSKVHDVLSGYRAFSRDFVKNFPAESNGFEVETEMTIFAINKKYKIKEIPVKYKNRPAGSKSKLKTFKDGIKVLYKIHTLSRENKRRR